MGGFNDGENGNPLVFCSEQGNNKPQRVENGDVTSNANFIGAANDIDRPLVIGGGDGYAERGILFGYNGTLVQGAKFRAATKVNGSSAVVAIKKNHTFYYNFHNFGTTAIDFSIQGVNSSGDVEGPVTNIKLAPGESIRVSFTVKYLLGSANKNVMLYFTMNEEVSNLRLGVAISVVLDSDNKYVEDETAENVNIIAELPEGISLKPSYRTIFKVGSKLVLPKAEDVENTTSHNILGWTDAEGNALTDGAILTKDITIKPVLSVDVTVTITDMPEGITVKDTYKTVWQSGEKLVLPTKDDLNNTTGKNLLGWTDAEGGEIQDGLTLTEDITIKPVFSTPAKVALNLPDNFTVSADYRVDYEVGDAIVLPTEAQVTNNTGRVFKCWINSETKEIINDGDIIESETLTIEPEFKAEVTVSLKLPAGVTVDGYAAKQFKEETLAMPANVTDTTGNGDILGWYNTATGVAVTAETVLDGDMTIAPYWKNIAGYTYLDIGSGSNSGYNTSEIPGDIVKDISASNYKGSIKGAANKPVIAGNFQGSSLKIDKFVSAGSAIRFDTVREGDSTANAAIYEFSYTVENRGAEELRLSIYQVNAGGEYKTPTFYDYESRYRTEVTLAAGECKTVIGQYDLDANGNYLTYVVVEKDVSALNFAFAMANKTIEAIGDEYKGQAALNNPATISYNPANNYGITVKDAYLNQRAGRLLVAPTAEQIENSENLVILKWQLEVNGTDYDLSETMVYSNVLVPSSGATLKVVLAEDVTVTYETPNGVSIGEAKTAYKQGQKLALPELTATTTDGRKHAGWYDKATGKIVTNDYVIMSDMTLAPYFENKDTALTPLSGKNLNTHDGVDYVSLAEGNTGSFKNQGAGIGGDVKGIILNFDGDLQTGNSFRIKTSYSGVAGESYQFTFGFTNWGTTELKFTVYQIQGSATTEGMPKQEITLGAGESITITLTLPALTAKNGNALTYFVMDGDVSNMSLGMSMSYHKVN